MVTSPTVLDHIPTRRNPCPCPPCRADASTGPSTVAPAHRGSASGHAAAAIPAPTRRRDRAPGSDAAGLPAMLRDDAGMSTVEYAIGCVAAAGFAALLYSVVTGDSVTAALTQLVQRALTAGF